MKRTYNLLIAIVLVMAVLSAPLSAKTVLKVWDFAGPTNDTSKAWWEWVETTFEERNPDIDVQYEYPGWGEYRDKLITNIAGGIGPDVAHLSVLWARDLYDKGALISLNSFVEKTPDARPEAFYPIEAIFNQKSGHVFGIPDWYDSHALIYNRTHLQEAGLDDSPNAMETWDDFVDFTKKLTKRENDRITRSGYSYTMGLEMFTSWLYSNGGSFYGSDITVSAFNSRQGVETVQFLQDLTQRHRLDPNFGDFRAETSSITSWGTWSGAYIVADNPDINFAMTSMPQGPSGTGRGTTSWGNMLSILQGSKNLDAAWRYIQFYTGVEANLQQVMLYLRPNVPRMGFFQSAHWAKAVDLYPWMANAPNVHSVGGPMAFYRFAEVDRVLTPLISRAVAGLISPNEAMLQGERIVNEILKE